MTEFDNKLNRWLHREKGETGDNIYEIADKANINRRTLYNFASSANPMNGENTNKLMKYLNLTVELTKK